MPADHLLTKPDWSEAQQRLTAWWQGKVVDRVCLGLTAPVTDRTGVPSAPDRAGMTPERYYLDTDFRLREAEHQVASRHWLGEAFPNVSCDFGPGSLALYVGSEPGWTWETVWFEPWPPAEAGALPEYDDSHPLWVRHRDMVAAFAKAGGERWLTNIPDLIEALDILAALRGPQPLLFDLVDRPEWVHACCRQVLDLFFRYYDQLYDRCRRPDGGVSFTAFQVWAPGRMAKLQCDFSAMISPGMFAEFERPYLQEQCRRLDYTVYHWDGPGAIQHLDQLLAIPELNAIQWTPGAGNPDVWHERWYPLYRRARDGGKSLLLIGGWDPEGMARTVRTFGPEGLYLFAGAPSREEAEALLVRAARGWK